MPVNVVDGRFKRFILDNEEEGIYERYDVQVLEKDPEPWVEIYRVVEDGEEVLKDAIITAPVSDVIEFFEKISSYIKSVCNGPIRV